MCSRIGIWSQYVPIQNFIQILDLSSTSSLCMSLTYTEIKIEIWISFFLSFIWSGSVLPPQKCLAMAYLSGRGSELFERPFLKMVL